MRYETITLLLKYAEKIGLKTLGDLKAYKEARNIKDNATLKAWLAYDANYEI